MADYLLAQASVLGSMLISPEIVGEVLTSLSPEDFSEPLGVELYKAIRQLYLDGNKIDAVTALNAMGGPSESRRDYLLGAMDRTPTAANFREYVSIVREQAKLTKLQQMGFSLAGADMDLARARELVERMQGLLADRKGVESMSMEQGIVRFYENLDRKPEYLPWGIDFLDEGLTAERGDFIVLGGYPSDGKTALALYLAYQQAATHRVAFFSLETHNDKLFNRLYSSVAQVSGKKIKHRDLSQTDYYNLERKAEEVRGRNLHLIKASSMTVDDIRAYTLARQFDVIYIDYLTLIPDPGKTEYDQATNISKGLHRLAQDHGVTVVALSQLSRPDSGAPKPPTLSSLRSSGQIEQDADIVMFIYREEPGRLRSRRVLRVAKNKEGETGQIPLIFNGDTQTFKVDHYRPVDDRPARKEPEYKQINFTELPNDEPLPSGWEESRTGA